jgi:hypothetical protein
LISPGLGVVYFFTRSGTDYLGRLHASHSALDDISLERTHDYIQWLFPTVTASSFSAAVPALEKESIRQLRDSDEARRGMLVSFGLRLGDLDSCEIFVKTTGDLPERADIWLTSGSHNYRRLTQLLESLITQGLPLYARALWDYLNLLGRSRGGGVDSASLSHWRRQVS